MQAARAAPAEAEPAAARLQLAGQAALPGEWSENETVLVSEGEPETEMTEWGGRMAGKGRDEAGGAGPAGCARQAGPGCGAEAASGAVRRRQGLAGSAARSEAAVEGEAMAASVGARQGPAVCESEVVAVEQGPGAGWGAGMLMVRPVVEPK